MTTSTYPPPLTQTYTVCPRCTRPAIPHFVDCDGHVFPGAWACVEHGPVTPIHSAVINPHPYVPDWSTA
jgi:hypothetical protein